MNNLNEALINDRKFESDDVLGIYEKECENEDKRKNWDEN